MPFYLHFKALFNGIVHIECCWYFYIPVAVFFVYSKFILELFTLRCAKIQCVTIVNVSVYCGINHLL